MRAGPRALPRGISFLPTSFRNLWLPTKTPPVSTRGVFVGRKIIRAVLFCGLYLEIHRDKPEERHAEAQPKHLVLTFFITPKVNPWATERLPFNYLATSAREMLLTLA